MPTRGGFFGVFLFASSILSKALLATLGLQTNIGIGVVWDCRVRQSGRKKARQLREPLRIAIPAWYMWHTQFYTLTCAKDDGCGGSAIHIPSTAGLRTAWAVLSVGHRIVNVAANASASYVLVAIWRYKYWTSPKAAVWLLFQVLAARRWCCILLQNAERSGDGGH